MISLSVDGFDWDSGNRTKCQKHGVSIAEIEAVFRQDGVLLMDDGVHSADEDRFVVIGEDAERRPIFVCFTFRDRHDRRYIRPISARRMHNRERKAYDRTFQR